MILKEKLKFLKKYFIIEPLVIFLTIPSNFLQLGVQNFHIEKTCRVNLNLTRTICDNVILKKIECNEETNNDRQTDFASLDQLNSENLGPLVCWAERESQKEISVINAIGTPISQIFPIIVILFAGGWSDRRNLRKPCLLFPLLGTLLALGGLILSAVFFDDIPMEFGNLVLIILPAVFGGAQLFTMGVFSYLTAMTPEEDRTFRFGVFTAFLNIVNVVSTPFSATLYQQLGYIKLFTLSNFIVCLGVLYLIFFVKEIKEDKEEEDSPEEEKKKSCLAEFFDPTLALDCLKVLTKKREFNGKFYLVFLTITFFLFVVPDQSEGAFLYSQTRIRYNWNENQFNSFLTYNSIVNAIGPVIVIALFNKILKFSDSAIGLISSILAIISRVVFAFAPDKTTFYIAGFLDLFLSIRGVAMRAIISMFVLQEELGRVFSMLGVTEAIGNAVLSPIYNVVYTNTVDSFSGAFYLLSEVFYIPCAIIFAVLYFVLKTRKRKMEQADENGDNKENTADGQINEAFELQTSHL